MTTWFTSDLHLGHANILKYTNRPWTTVEEMDEAIVENWNNVVGKTDRVFVLGDVYLCRRDRAMELLSRLRGNKHLVWGNHDRQLRKQPSNLFVSAEWISNTSIDGIPIIMCHFPMRSWDRMHYGSVMLHGHTHGGMAPIRNSIDVGIDSPYVLPEIPYRPFSWEEIKAAL